MIPHTKYFSNSIKIKIRAIFLVLTEKDTEYDEPNPNKKDVDCVSTIDRIITNEIEYIGRTKL